MSKLSVITFFILMVGSVFAETKTVAKIQETKNYIQQNFQKEFESLQADSKGGFECLTEPVPDQLWEAITNLETLYTRYIKEHKFNDHDSRKRIEVIRDWYRMIHHAKEKELCPKSDGFFVTTNYLQMHDELKLDSASGPHLRSYTFQGPAIGGGYEQKNKRFNLRFSADAFYLQGEKSSSSVGGSFTMDLGVPLTDTLRAYLGLPVFYRSVSIDQGNAKNALFTGPQVSLQKMLKKNFVMFGKLSYLQDHAAYGLGLGYYLP